MEASSYTTSWDTTLFGTSSSTNVVRARVEHVFAHQKNRYGLLIRTIGIKRAEAKVTLANLAYNMDRLIFHERRGTAG